VSTCPRHPPVQVEADPDLVAFVARLPKTETHLHLEGAIDWNLLRTLGDAVPAEPPAAWAPDYRFPDFTTFDTLILSLLAPWFTSAERYHTAARGTLARLVAQNVRYVETSFHLGILEFIAATGPDIIAAIRDAAPPGLTVRVFAGLAADGFRPPLHHLIGDSLRWRWLDGIDLHGHERYPLPDWVPTHWRRAVDAGKETKAHAGEFGPAANVREAVERLGVRRVQHGVRAVEDPAVLDLLCTEGVTCDVTPISNLKLGVAASWAEHPVRRLFEAGVRVTISTDDPVIFGNSLTDEYLGLATHGGFTRAELCQLAANGFAVARLPEADRRAALAELDALERAD
jgi:adenosine deaminase